VGARHSSFSGPSEKVKGLPTTEKREERAFNFYSLMEGGRGGVSRERREEGSALSFFNLRGEKAKGRKKGASYLSSQLRGGGCSEGGGSGEKKGGPANGRCTFTLSSRRGKKEKKGGGRSSFSLFLHSKSRGSIEKEKE